jgi:dipeptidyl aminopeptidase/acylaminoacyl peptidase
MATEDRVNAVRPAVALLVSVLSLSACSSLLLGPCASPPLVTTSGHPEGGGLAVHWWEPDGSSVALDPGRLGWDAVVSPDGTTVAFDSPEGSYSDSNGYPKSRVALLTIETGEVTPVSADIPNSTVGDLRWSSDGSEVAFVRRVDDVREIVAVRVDDGAERSLITLNDRQSGSFDWSSDGRELLVPTYSNLPAPLPPAPQPTMELRRYSIETGDYVAVDTPHSSIGHIAWSPDGRFVGMSADIPGTARPWRLYVLDLESGISSPIDRRRGGPASLTWSGSYLLYTYWLRVGDDPLVLMRWDSRLQDRELVDRPGIENVLHRFGSISAPTCGAWNP